MMIYKNGSLVESLYKKGKKVIEMFKKGVRLLVIELKDYTQFSGYGYIDTGFVISSTNANKLRIKHKVIFDTLDNTLFGVQDTSRLYWGNNGGEIKIATGSSVFNTGITNIEIGKIYDFDLDFNTKTYIIDGTTYTNSSVSTYTGGNRSLLMGASNINGNLTNYTKNSKTLSFQVYENDALVVDLIPMLIGEDSNGMYDKVSKKYLTNANTVGTVESKNFSLVEPEYKLLIDEVEVETATNTADLVNKIANHKTKNGNWKLINNPNTESDMNRFFSSYASITTLDLSNFDTSNVNDTGNMFSGCSSLTILILSNFDTSNVDYMSGMFHYCSSLTTLDLSSFDTGNVTNMINLFNSCSSLTTLNLSNFNTANVTSMANMFYRCSGLTTLNLSNFNTANVTSMANMFGYCSSLTTLDLSSFDTGSVTSVANMFKECSSLTTVYVRTQADADKFRTASGTPATINFIVK